jgi:hypothetical protein
MFLEGYCIISLLYNARRQFKYLTAFEAVSHFDTFFRKYPYSNHSLLLPIEDKVEGKFEVLQMQNWR